MRFTVRPASAADLDAMKSLLDAAHLPLDGLDEQSATAALMSWTLVQERVADRGCE